MSKKLHRAASLSALAFAGALFSQTPAGAVSFVNGSFETGDFTGWTHGPASTVDYPGSDGPWASGYDGNHWVWLGNWDFQSHGASYIQQTVSGFVVGQSYTLSFLQASEYVNSETTFLDITGVGTLNHSFTSTPSHTSDTAGRGLWNNWETESWSFVADATSLTFKLNGNVGVPYDTGVDKFSITANTSVPDGGATAGLFGMALAGLACFRRWKQAPATDAPRL